MPNHVTNRVEVWGGSEEVAALKAAHLLTKEVKDGQPFLHFDFATIVEQPPIVNEVEESSETEFGFYALTGLAQQKMAFFAEPALVRYKRFHPSFGLTPLSTPEQMAEHMAKHNPRMLEKGRRRLECFRRAVERRGFARTLRTAVSVEPGLERLYTEESHG